MLLMHSFSKSSLVASWVRLILISLLSSVLLITSLYGQVFTNISDSVPLNIGFASSDNWGSGVSFYDFNQDGWDDISVCMENDSIVFFMNDNGNLTRLSSFIYGDGIVKHLLWVDYDNDGYLDIFLTVKDGQYRLFKNDGDFNFTDVTVSAGLSLSNASHWGASFADIDNDGYLDLYIAKYSFGFTENDTDKLNQLYHNNGDGTFTNITLSAGVGDSIRASFKGIWFDYDLDGFVDLYVMNDRVHWNNTLYRNNGDLTFTDVTDSAGLRMHSQDPMTLTVGDFDNDGDLDIYLTNTGVIPNLHNKRAHLYVNNGDGTFTNQAEQYGVDCRHWSWGAVWMDYDNDTWQDLFVATGLPLAHMSQDTLNHFYINQGGQGFVLDNSPFPSEYISKSFSVAKGDINNDGYVDIIVMNDEPDEPLLWLNSGGNNNFIKILPKGTLSNRMAIGTWVKIFVGGQQFTKYTFCGENYVGQDSQHLIFGLGSASMVDSVIVTYTSGHTDKYYNLPANSTYVFTEGETLFATIDNSTGTLHCFGDTTLLNIQVDSSTQVFWNTGDTSLSVHAHESGMYYAVLESPHGIVYHSDTVELNFIPSPLIIEDITNVSCHGESDGAITLNEVTMHTLPFNSSILWSDGASSMMISGLSEGTYAYFYTTDYGCEILGEVVIDSPFPLAVSLNIQNDDGNQTGEIDFTVFGGIPPYQTFLDGQLVSASPITNLSQGTYTLEVEDALNCILVNEVLVESTLGMKEFNSSSVGVFPNPNSGKYYIKTTDKIVWSDIKIKVFDYQGRLVYQDVLKLNEAEFLVDNSFLSPGIYTLIISSEESSNSIKLMIDH